MSKKALFVPYGVGHTKHYTKSIVADYLVERSTDSDEIVYRSDVHLLLRQKSIHRKIGLDLLRNYVQGLEQQEIDKHDFTDDELFKLIEPKSINNLTTAYEYARYLQDNSEQVKSRFDKLKKEKSAYDEYVNRFHKSDTEGSKDV